MVILFYVFYFGGDLMRFVVLFWCSVVCSSGWWKRGRGGNFGVVGRFWEI